MYNTKINKIIKSKGAYKNKNFLFCFKRLKNKHNYIFKSFVNNEKKILTNLCFHQNKYKTINNFMKINRHALLFKITFNNCKLYTKK